MKSLKPQSSSLLAVFFLAVLFFINGCSSGKKALERGDYYSSVLTSTNRLRRNPDHKKSVQTLRLAYPLALNFYEGNITNLKLRNDRNKWQAILDTYGRINHMYEEIRRAPGALKVIPNPVNYYNELDEARNNAAEEAYQFALLEISKGTREGAKNAYLGYQEADGYVPGYKDVIQRMEDAYWLATVKVLVEPIPVAYASVDLNARFFEDKIHENLKNQPINQFVRFLTENELEEIGFPADHILEMQFDDFVVGEVHTKERQIQQVKDSVKVATVKSSLVGGGRTDSTPKTDEDKDSDKEDNYIQICHKNADGSYSTITINDNDLAEHVRHGDTLGKCADTTTPSDNNENTEEVKYVEVCHKNLDGSYTTLTVKESDLINHQRHGDRLGSCTEEADDDVAEEQNQQEDNNAGNSGNTGNTDDEDTNSDDQGTNNEDSGTNQNQGDQQDNSDNQENTGNQNNDQNNDGTDKDNQENEDKNDKEESDKDNSDNDNSDNDKVTICHRTKSGRFVTLQINKNAIRAHLTHGDKMGACDDSDQNKNKDNSDKKNKEKGDGKSNSNKEGDNKGNSNSEKNNKDKANDSSKEKSDSKNSDNKGNNKKDNQSNGNNSSDKDGEEKDSKAGNSNSSSDKEKGGNDSTNKNSSENEKKDKNDKEGQDEKSNKSEKKDDNSSKKDKSSSEDKKQDSKSKEEKDSKSGGDKKNDKGNNNNKENKKDNLSDISIPEEFDIYSLTASTSDEPILVIQNMSIVTDTTDIDVYGTVKATVYIFEKNLVSRGTLSVRVLDAVNGAVLMADKVQSEYVWSSQWGYFNGDERALTEEQLQITKQKEAPVPNDEELFYGFTEPIMGELMRRLRNYYRRF